MIIISDAGDNFPQFSLIWKKSAMIQGESRGLSNPSHVCVQDWTPVWVEIQNIKENYIVG